MTSMTLLEDWSRHSPGGKEQLAQHELRVQLTQTSHSWVIPSGDKTEQTAQNNTENAVDANNGESKESADSSETELETVKVSEREDYVALQDIDISTYVTLPEYKIRSRLSESESFRLHRFPAYIFSHIAETSRH